MLSFKRFNVSFENKILFFLYENSDKENKKYLFKKLNGYIYYSNNSF